MGRWKSVESISIPYSSLALHTRISSTPSTQSALLARARTSLGVGVGVGTAIAATSTPTIAVLRFAVSGGLATRLHIIDLCGGQQEHDDEQCGGEQTHVCSACC